MSTRFIEASKEACEMTVKVQQEWFPQLEKAVIKCLFDTKMRKRGNKVVLGRILKANDLIRRLTDTMAEEGCDYILFLDEVAFTNIPDADKVRLVRHELRHCKVTGTIEKPKYKIIPHDIEDFVIEIELNKDKINWATDAARLVTDIYEQIEETKNEEEQKKETQEPPAQQQAVAPKSRFGSPRTA
jgi:hypothetical protein